MKSILLLLSAAVVITLPCCTSKTTYHPDGTITVEKGVDSQAVKDTTGLGYAIIDRTSGK